jgi:hypothetical protein
LAQSLRLLAIQSGAVSPLFPASLVAVGLFAIVSAAWSSSAIMHCASQRLDGRACSFEHSQHKAAARLWPVIGALALKWSLVGAVILIGLNLPDFAPLLTWSLLGLILVVAAIPTALMRPAVVLADYQVGQAAKLVWQLWRRQTGRLAAAAVIWLLGNLAAAGLLIPGLGFYPGRRGLELLALVVVQALLVAGAFYWSVVFSSVFWLGVYRQTVAAVYPRYAANLVASRGRVDSHQRSLTQAAVLILVTSMGLAAFWAAQSVDFFGQVHL